MSEINKLLSDIQQKLKAPKGQTNAFGKYKYRSCEDIVEAVKPLLGGANLTMWDSIELIGERYYVKATVAITLGDSSVRVSAYAREPLEKKGSDAAQITGATSSYARKYALNGLFAIDDTKDADTMDNSIPEHRFKPGEKETIIAQVRACLDSGDGHGLKEILDEYKDPEEKMKVWGLFSSSERSSIKSMIVN